MRACIRVSTDLHTSVGVVVFFWLKLPADTFTHTFTPTTTLYWLKSPADAANLVLAVRNIDIYGIYGIYVCMYAWWHPRGAMLKVMRPRFEEISQRAGTLVQSTRGVAMPTTRGKGIFPKVSRCDRFSLHKSTIKSWLTRGPGCFQVWE